MGAPFDALVAAGVGYILGSGQESPKKPRKKARKKAKKKTKRKRKRKKSCDCKCGKGKRKGKGKRGKTVPNPRLTAAGNVRVHECFACGDRCNMKALVHTHHCGHVHRFRKRVLASSV